MKLNSFVFVAAVVSALAGCKPSFSPPPPDVVQNVVAAPQVGDCPATVVPGKSIGPISLGMTRAELEKIPATRRPPTAVVRDSHGNSRPFQSPMFPVTPGSRAGTLKVGAYEVVLSSDSKVQQISISTDGVTCLEVDGKKIPERDDAEKLSALFKDCGKLDVREGGNVVECAGGVRLKSGGYGGKQVGSEIDVIPAT
jgi:hypothetical protein